MFVAIRVDGNTEIGVGHVLRCLTLAEKLVDFGIQSIFYTRNISPHLYEKISKKFKTVRLTRIENSFNPIDEYSKWLGCSQNYDAHEFIDMIANLDIKFIIVDHYGINEEWETIVSVQHKRLIVLDDLANRRHKCDMLVDQSIGLKGNEYEELVSENCVTLLGPRYSLLNKNFELQTQAFVEKKYSLLINFGGADKDNYTLHVANLLEDSSLPSTLTTKIVVGKDYPCFSRLIDFVVSSRFKIKLIRNPNNMAREIAECKFSIGAGGVSLLERSSLGVPSILYTIANNQLHICEEYARLKLGPLIKKKDQHNAQVLSRAVYNFLDDIKLKQTINDNILAVDTFGTNRVVSSIVDVLDLFIVRAATLDDCKFIYECRYLDNDAALYINSKVPDYSQHETWYKVALKKKYQTHTIYTIGKQQIGYIRLDHHKTETELSICIHSKFQRRNIGSIMLKTFCEHHPELELVATVHKKNRASLKTFKNCGFYINNDLGAFLMLKR